MGKMIFKFPVLFTILFNIKDAGIMILMIIGIKMPIATSMGTGKCPVMKNCTVLVWSNFQGIWYEYASYGDYTTRSLYKCMKYTFSTTETEVNAVREFVSKWNDGLSSTNYEVQYDGFFDFILKTESGSEEKIWVLETDYNNFAILWTCYDYGALGEYFYMESSWILTRTSKEYAAVDVEIKIDEALKRHSIERISYDPVEREDCPNYPNN
ncbi:hypothetical protein O3M35_000489 [Rhynocoris fuscipes]|uniref:Uncharacterized protein n=1 Tax=Rhynocoris fuscipes TaxID=488301 RepID=A0AAW1DSS5_9HEMI